MRGKLLEIKNEATPNAEDIVILKKLLKNSNR